MATMVLKLILARLIINEINLDSGFLLVFILMEGNIADNYFGYETKNLLDSSSVF